MSLNISFPADSWRNQILQEFTPGMARLTLVADPDALLLEEQLLEGIRERGFELITFEDHVAFRYAYEAEFRSRWDRGEQTDLVVIMRAQANDLVSLPFDLLQAGRRLSFSLGDIFPDLSYPVVAALDRGDLDALYTALKRHAPGQLGDNATKEFILRHVFEMAAELIAQPADLLRMLLRRHYRRQHIPDVLEQRFIQILRQNNTFDEWPLEIIVPDREAFFTFLQERWPIFLDRVAAEGNPEVREDKKAYYLEIDGPADLPFDHHDIRVYMDNLFLEGLLHPVPHTYVDQSPQSWVSTGIQNYGAEDKRQRLIRLMDYLHSSVPTEKARYGEWFHFARGWAKLTLLAYEQENTIDRKVVTRFNGLQDRVDLAFTSWLTRRYAGLINLPPVPPVMLHHLPRFLARWMGEDPETKTALLLVDGLSLDQWLVVRETMVSQRPHYRLRENNIFAWIPTLTSVSRQAAFAGKPPIFFPNSIQTTVKEQDLWSQFWVDQGFSFNEIVYARGLGDGSLEPIGELLSHPKVRVAGLVIDKVDKIMHGMELGTAGMYNQIRQWVQQSYLTELLDLLLFRGFNVFLTSDHGNIAAEGCGSPAEGAVAELRGERVRIYSSRPLRDRIMERFPDALEWPAVGLPDTFLPLIAPARQAFVYTGERIVSHGGIALEEVIVPLIQIERTDR
ncbi:BREX-3 system phosphatase PglZ [Moorella naiadis]|uniref:BREX-3 system phosphatase PglZ n=1 Tax=Moorella naiadis (nom. illeg.) TaxID=3093670 RepID=UPI003D9CB9E7